jgi:hypothetical protein
MAECGDEDAKKILTSEKKFRPGESGKRIQFVGTEKAPRRYRIEAFAFRTVLPEGLQSLDLKVAA